MRTLLFLLLLSLPASAANLPHRINFQGKLLDNNNLPRNGSIGMQFRLYNVPSGGVALYTEPASGWESVQVTNGVFSVQIGTITALNPDLFAGASVYLGITVQPDSEMTPRQSLVMSPYAYTAAQLVQDSDIRVQAGASYSTFTAAGNLLVANGISAATASLSGSLTASSGTFTATGNTQYSLQTSSGLLVAGGTLSAQGGGGVSVLYGVVASTYTGNGADLVNVRPKISSATDPTTITMVANTETIVSSVAFTPSRVNSEFLVHGYVTLNRATNSLSTWTIKVRRNIGAVCTTASTQVDQTLSNTVPNTAGTSVLVPFWATDKPNTTSVVWYCLTLTVAAAQSYGVHGMYVMEAAP